MGCSVLADSLPPNLRQFFQKLDTKEAVNKVEIHDLFVVLEHANHRANERHVCPGSSVTVRKVESKEARE